MPTSLSEAGEVLHAHGPATRVVAGGTDLWPNMKRRHQKAESVVSLMRIRELSSISGLAAGRELRIGATATLSAILDEPAIAQRFPSLSRAIASISSPPLRNMATLGGNLCLDTRCTYYNQTEDWRRSIDYCMKEEGTVCWVAPSSPRCWAHSASDSAPVLCALGARIRLSSKDGDRVIPVGEIFHNDGIDFLTLRRGEVLTEVLLPSASDKTRCRSSFWKLRRRGSIDFAVLSVAATVQVDRRGRVLEARVFLGAVGSRPLEVATASDLLRGKELSEDSIREVADVARKVATPMDNTDFKAQWRGHMAERYTRAALREIAGLEPDGALPRHQMIS